MGSLLRRVLSAALCLVVLPPPGWCCYVGRGACCEKPAPTDSEAPCGGCRQGCGCPPAESSPQGPTRVPAPQPVKSCCCQKGTGDRPEPGRGPVLADAPALPAAPPHPADALGEPVPPEPRPVAFSPQHLRVLLCVWLC